MFPPHVRWLFANFILLMAAGCGRHESAVIQGNRTQVLHQSIGAEPQDLDPQFLQFQSHFNVLMALNEGLVGYDPRDLHPVPGVAERWEISADGRTYTFHLRANATWSNGDPMTAQDFEFSARRILSPKFGSPFRSYFDDVLGAKAYSASPAPDFSTVGIRALDERTLRIELAHPAPYFLFLLGNWSWYPVHRPTVEQYGHYDQPGTAWTLPGRFVGNGPFSLAEWRPGQCIVVRKNPRYWDAARVRLAEIRFYFYDNVDAEERAYRSGQLHITETVPISKLRDYSARRPSPLMLAENFSTYGYALGLNHPPFSDVRVRRALSLAIDRDLVVASQVGSGILPASSFIPPVGSYRYAGEAAARFDPVEARRLLAAAGYPGGQGFPPVEIATNAGLRHQEIGQIVQQMWQKHLGIHVGIASMEAKVFFTERINRRLPLHRLEWTGDFPDPIAFLTVFLQGGPQNSASYANPEYDRLALEAAHTVDDAARRQSYQAAETVLLRDLPIIPIFYDSTLHLMHPAVRGRFPNLMDIHPYQGISLEP